MAEHISSQKSDAVDGGEAVTVSFNDLSLQPLASGLASDFRALDQYAVARSNDAGSDLDLGVGMILITIIATRLAKASLEVLCDKLKDVLQARLESMNQRGTGAAGESVSIAVSVESARGKQSWVIRLKRGSIIGLEVLVQGVGDLIQSM